MLNSRSPLRSEQLRHIRKVGVHLGKTLGSSTHKNFMQSMPACSLSKILFSLPRTQLPNFRSPDGPFSHSGQCRDPLDTFGDKDQSSQALGLVVVIGKPHAKFTPKCGFLSYPAWPPGESNLLLSEFHLNGVTADWDSTFTTQHRA